MSSLLYDLDCPPTIPPGHMFQHRQQYQPQFSPQFSYPYQPLSIGYPPAASTPLPESQQTDFSQQPMSPAIPNSQPSPNIPDSQPISQDSQPSTELLNGRDLWGKSQTRVFISLHHEAARFRRKQRDQQGESMEAGGSGTERATRDCRRVQRSEM